MKESFWSVMIVVIGVVSIAFIYFFQNVTTQNEQDYTILKEVTEAAMYDAVDLASYSKTGQVRIDREKFEFRESYGMRWYDYDYMRDDVRYGGSYLEDIKSVAAMYGEDPEVIQELYEQGFSLMELEELIYQGL